jgi:uncharacterized protein
MVNAVDYFEIGSPDPEASKAFYGKLFGWNIGEPSEQGYRPINQTQGGVWDTSAMGGANWGIFYVHVDDVKEAVKQAQDLGAKIAIPYTAGGGIEFAHLIDPQRNRFGVWKPAK